MRREGKLPKRVDVVVDSVILELSVKSLRRSRFERISGRTIRSKYYKGFKVYVATDLTTKTILFIELCPIGVTDSVKLLPIIKAVRKLGHGSSARQLAHLPEDEDLALLRSAHALQEALGGPHQ